ncbi:hypothetical protein BDV23DRAFT_164651 [Aspergillus alliaceus]|uniref:Uncharacterized protein n=1 Tax=Petromyces alliaceus TaxID=209559 RepID=A0A5N7BUX0_PETAA|nr:hypothetical protein BDV23DRAFT_164651 [Aspergillus alliaceus]
MSYWNQADRRILLDMIWLRMHCTVHMYIRNTQTPMHHPLEFQGRSRTKGCVMQQNC